MRAGEWVDGSDEGGGGSKPPCPRRAKYRHRRPEKSVLYEVVERHLDPFLAAVREQNPEGSGLPSFVEKEFRKFLGCGRLDRGFFLLECASCGERQPVAFSCRGRGFCPSCLSRRMEDVALHLCDRVLPMIPVRQWVVSFPAQLRFRLAFDAKLQRDFVRLAVRAVGIVTDPDEVAEILDRLDSAEVESRRHPP